MLLVAYTMSAFNFQELSKVPFLIDHYKVHLAKNPQMGVLDFVYQHYVNCDLRVSDFDQNMKLPFKGESKTCQNLVQFCVQQPQLVSLVSILNEIPIHQTPCFEETFHSQFQHSIWQPPKLA